MDCNVHFLVRTVPGLSREDRAGPNREAGSCCRRGRHSSRHGAYRRGAPGGIPNNPAAKISARSLDSSSKTRGHREAGSVEAIGLDVGRAGAPICICRGAAPHVLDGPPVLSPAARLGVGHRGSRLNTPTSHLYQQRHPDEVRLGDCRSTPLKVISGLVDQPFNHPVVFFGSVRLRRDRFRGDMRWIALIGCYAISAVATEK
jgi:hypothetical protein